MTVSNAIAAAAHLHKAQVDKAGAAHILHPLRVMLAMGNEEEGILAVSTTRLRTPAGRSSAPSSATLPPWLEKGLDALTRRHGETYEAFIERVAENDLARRVKLADLADNMDLSLIPAPTEEDRRRVKKYRRATQRLAEARRERGVSG